MSPIPSEVSPGERYLHFVRREAARLRAQDSPPANRQAWRPQRADLRRRLLQSWGGFPANPAPLLPRKLGELQRDGYRIEKIVFQTLPNVWMTANAYVPDRPGRLPAILAVHGHWRGAKQDPVVQARCIGAAKLGFFVLAVDAFGAGERGVGKALGEYHGEMTAATLLPVGLPLSGLQVYENGRAVDYLSSRPEVDPKRIGITGASGGGNQTMYAAAWDERFAAAVPVCSVGNYQAYLGAACCLCEVVPGALRYTEEWGILGLTAPRGLMVINATRDARQFSVEEAQKSLAVAKQVFHVHDQADALRHTIFESGHDYSRPMREAMYGWMTKYLKGEGEGAPIPEPEIQTEDPELLRCFPGETRPDDWVTIPKFAAAQARTILQAKPAPDTLEAWGEERAKRRRALANAVLGGFPTKTPLQARLERTAEANLLHFQSEPGIALTARLTVAPNRNAPLAILLDLDGSESRSITELTAAFQKRGYATARLDLRATGKFAWAGDSIGAAPDHTTAEWGLWLGRPLLGQWVWDVRRLLDAMANVQGALPKEIAVCGVGSAGLVALSAAALEPRLTRVATLNSLATYVTDEPYRGQRLGVLPNGILREVGDVAHLVALIAPRRIVISGGVLGNGRALSSEELGTLYRPAAQIWKLFGSEYALTLSSETDLEAFVRAVDPALNALERRQ